MEELHKPQNAFIKLKSSLKPYAKSRKEATQIRRMLRMYLNCHLENKDPCFINRPLLVPESPHSLDGSTHGVKGLLKDYLRCIQMNINAKNEYAALSKEHQSNSDEEDIEISSSNSSLKEDSTSSMISFVDLVRKKHRHERLNIIQEFIEKLSQKPAGHPDFIDPKNVLREVAVLPQVPSEVMQISGFDQDSISASLEDFIIRLEKSVFIAKAHLKREQKLLVDVKTKQSTIANKASRLSALQTTRDELIQWVESELKKSEKMPSNINENIPDDLHRQDRVLLDVEKSLELLHKQYSTYVDARESLLACMGEKIAAPISFTLDNHPKADHEEQTNTKRLNLVYPYLRDLASITSRQKGLTQQKVHLTRNLTKQLEEANSGFDRLAHESHLLPTYPMPISDSIKKKRESSLSFSDEISNQEKLNSSRHAQIWAYAANSASQSTTEIVLQKVENGNVSLMDAQTDIKQLSQLLDTAIGDSSINLRNGLWADLNENLDKIRAEILEND